MKKTVNSVRLPLESVTLQDVAERCNVHKSTVYRALIGSKRVGQATTEKVRLVAREMGYDHTLNLAAQQLSARKTGRAVINHLVVLFLPQGFLEDFYYSQLFSGIQTELRKSHYDLITTVVKGIGENVLPLSIVRGDVDGVLMLCRLEWGKWLLDSIAQEGNISHCPTISVMSPLEGCSSVVADERNGAFLALRHLIEIGHRKVLFINGPEVPPYHLEERLTGYREACETSNLFFEDVVQTHILEPARSLTEDLHELVAHYFDGKQGFSAVMTRNDAHAVILRRVLAQNGLRVPQDISLVGFDDTRPLAFHYAETLAFQYAEMLAFNYMETDENFLTTVRLPLEEIGRRAVSLLVQSITGEAEREDDISLPVQLMVRRSTAPPSRDLAFTKRLAPSIAKKPKQSITKSN